MLRLALLLAVLATSAAPVLRAQEAAQAAQPPAPAQDMIDALDLRDMPLDQVLALIERLTGKSVIRMQQMGAPTFTFSSNRPLRRDEAIVALESLLALNQIGLVPLGDAFLRVVPLGNVRLNAPELYLDSVQHLEPSGRVISRLFTGKFLRASEIQGMIANLLDPSAAIVLQFERSNSLLITDQVANIQRVERVLAEIDKPATLSVSTRFHTLRFAKASDVANQIRNTASGALQTFFSQSTTLVADERSNQIVVTTDPEQQAYFEELIARFDVPADPNTRVDVIYLRHADGKEVAALLTQLVTGQARAAAESTFAGPGAAPAPQPAQGQPAAPLQLDGATGSAQFSRNVTIVADERTNAIVVSGTQDDIRLLRELIDKIDVVLAQVRIEVLIAEVSLGDNDRSGIDALEIAYANDRFGNARITMPGLNLNGNIQDQSLSAAIGSSAERTNVRFLSNPIIVTTHNKEATILVGEARPLVTATQTTDATGGTSSGLRSTVNYRDIGIELTVTPLIGADNSIQLEVNQQVDDILGEVSIDGNDQPIIGRRQAQSFINVADGEIVVLGGLQATRESRSRSRFGPIPFLGDLLGARRYNESRTELLIFIRPTVMRGLGETTADALEGVTGRPDEREILERLDRAPPAEPEPPRPPRTTFRRLP